MGYPQDTSIITVLFIFKVRFFCIHHLVLFENTPISYKSHYQNILESVFVSIDNNNIMVKFKTKRSCDARNESCGEESYQLKEAQGLSGDYHPIKTKYKRNESCSKNIRHLLLSLVNPQRYKNYSFEGFVF